MRLRTFTASDMPGAMKMAKELMGENAIIISSEEGQSSVTVTAAIDIDDEAMAPVKPFEPITARDSLPDDLRFAIQGILRFHNVPELFVAKILQKAAQGSASAMAIYRQSNKQDERYLHRLVVEKMLEHYYHFDPLLIPEPKGKPSAKPLRLMLVGAPGIGKTMTCAKIATRVAMAKEPLMVFTTDNKRAGGIEQLQAFTDILGVDLGVATSRTDLWKQTKSIAPDTHVIIDTAGCNPYEDDEWQEIESYATIENIEPVLVLPAAGDSEETIDMTEIFSALPIKRLLITRADSTRRFGSILAAAAAHELSFSHVSTSSSVTDSLHILDAAHLAKLLLRYQTRT